MSKEYKSLSSCTIHQFSVGVRVGVGVIVIVFSLSRTSRSRNRTTSTEFDKQLIVICLSSCLALVNIKLGNIC
jgi:hypothetical protein